MLIFSANSLAAQDEGYFVQGIFKVDEGNDKDSKVELMRNGVKVKTIQPSGSGKFEETLDFNAQYSFVFSKPGYITKSVAFNTEVPADRIQDGFVPWSFMCTIFKQYDGVNTVIFNQPVGKIYFHKEDDDFGYDTDYTKSIQSELDRIEREIEQKKEEEKEQQKQELLAQKEAEAAAKKAAAEEAKRKAEEEAQRKKEEEAKRKAEEQAQKEAEAEQKRLAQAQADEEKRKAAAAADEEKRRAAEAKAAEDARRKAEAEADAEARRQQKAAADEEKRRLAEAQAAEDAKRKADAEAAEAERKRLAEARAAEDAKRKAQAAADAEAKRQADAKAAEEAKAKRAQAMAEQEAKRQAAAAAANEARNAARAKAQAAAEEKRKAQAQLMADLRNREDEVKYADNRTEEYLEEGNKKITKVTINNGDHVTIYRKVVHSWGGIYYFKDDLAISQLKYQQEAY